MKARRRQKNRTRVGQRLTVEIADMAPGGWGIGTQEQPRVFVRHGLPGDRLDVRVVRCERGRVEAVIERIYDRPMQIQAAACDHAPVCGGCLWQHVPYELQLDLKRKMVQFCFSEAHLDAQIIRAPLASPSVFAYRNKMDFTFGRNRQGQVALGLYEAGIRSRGEIPAVFDVMHCGLQSEAGNRIVAAVRQWVLERDLPPYDPARNAGVLRSLVIRESIQTGQVLVLFVASENCREDLAPVARSLMQDIPSVCGVVLSVNTRRSKNAAPEEVVVLSGDGEIFERINGLDIRVSPTSFLQVNTKQAEQLYDQTVAFAHLTAEDEVLDLYCGTGTLSLLLAKHARRVTGIEVVGTAIEDAEENARHNGMDNARFLCGDVLEVLPDLTAEGYAPDVVTVNPPRAGVFRSVIDRICKHDPRRVVYVSCNPETLARDVVRFLKGGYALTQAQPVDMFPHTPHVEVVVCLDRP